MTGEPTKRKWRKSSHSASNDQCVEMDNTRTAFRHSKIHGIELHFEGYATVTSFITMVKGL
ncbi:MAG: DUF397 domain-containing protein [Actinophytocola sp.]|uniref:DUF397 domain-containing protein n=1 Tax=Actinophytocola sp. TaxID=1872138 RepID=UPI003C70D75A